MRHINMSPWPVGPPWTPLDHAPFKPMCYDFLNCQSMLPHSSQLASPLLSSVSFCCPCTANLPPVSLISLGPSTHTVKACAAQKANGTRGFGH